MSNVTLVNVNKTYEKGVRAVQNVSLDIRDREFHVLVGPSGCGKSTLLRLIAGLETPENGRIYMDGICINDKTPADRNVSMVFQNFSLYPHMSVFQNIAFGLRVRGAEPAEIEDKVNKIARELGLSDVLYRKPRELSGGQRQRVAIGRALVREPGIFLLDEPFSNVDAKLRKELRDELVSLRRRIAGTFLYVTHDISEAMVLGDRISVMNNGEILRTAAPAVLYNEPAERFVADFLGKKDFDPANSHALPENRIMGHFEAQEIRLGETDKTGHENAETDACGKKTGITMPIAELAPDYDLRSHLLDIAARDFTFMSFSPDDVVLCEIPDSIRLPIELPEIEECVGYRNVRAVLRGTDASVFFRAFPSDRVGEYIFIPAKACRFCAADGMKLNTTDTVFDNSYTKNGEIRHIFADSVKIVLPTVKKTLFGRKNVQQKGRGLMLAQAYGDETLGGKPCKRALFLHIPELNADVTVITADEFSVYDFPEMMITCHSDTI